jgi:hypothetical protein
MFPMSDDHQSTTTPNATVLTDDASPQQQQRPSLWHTALPVIMGQASLRRETHEQVRSILTSLERDAMGRMSPLSIGQLLMSSTPALFQMERIAHGEYGTVYCMHSPSLLGTFPVALKAVRLVDIQQLPQHDDHMMSASSTQPMHTVQYDSLAKCLWRERICAEIESGHGQEHDNRHVVFTNMESVQSSVEESRVLEIVTRLVLADVCPFFPLMYHDKLSWTSRNFFMEYSPHSLHQYWPQVSTLGKALSLWRQTLVGILCLDGILGICHDDLYDHNILTQPVSPAIYRFQYNGRVVEWFNHAVMAKLTDFGLCSGKSFLASPSEDAPLAYYPDDQMELKQEHFQGDKILMFHDHHILQFQHLPHKARDLVSVMATFKKGLVRTGFMSLSLQDATVMDMIINAVIKSIAQAIFAPGGHRFATRQDLSNFILDVISPTFLAALGVPDVAELMLPHQSLDAPIQPCGITRNDAPLQFDVTTEGLITLEQLQAPMFAS